MSHRFRVFAVTALVGSLAAVALTVRYVRARGLGEPDGPPALVASERTDPQLPQHLLYLRLESRALAGNLLGDPHLRELGVLLPPSYFEAEERPFPVVYLLHGLGAKQDGQLGLADVQRSAFAKMSTGELPECILVAIDGSTSLGGSYYARSPTIGDFETYVVREIVGAIEAHFRARADVGSRAIGGFSMGGQGAIKLALKYPGVYSAVGALSPSPLSFAPREGLYRRALADKRIARTPKELETLYPFDTAWTIASIYAKAAAFSPARARPPLYLELPFQHPAPLADPVWARWREEEPLALLNRDPGGLRMLHTLYLDHGNKETILGVQAFDRALQQLKIPFRHEVFEGSHSDDFQQRHLRMLRHLTARWAPGA